MIKILREMDSENLLKYIANLPDKKVTILARTHSLLEKLSMLLEEAHIDHVYIGKDTALTNSEEFRRFHAFLKLIVNPFDAFAFLLIKDIIGLSAADYAEIRQIAASTGESHFNVYMDSQSVLGNEKFMDFFEKWKPKDDITTCTAEMSYLDFPFDIDPIREFISKLDKTLNISEYLDWLATIDVSDEVKEGYEGLTLMTGHASKGCEWDTVIVAGCNEEIIPSKQAIRNGEEESERRLFYVMMTRARNNLILTIRPTVTETNGREYVNPESRFIGEAI